MKLGRLIENTLEEKFCCQFNMEDDSRPSIEKYIITLKNSNQECFKINVEIKNDTRLTITSEPEKYGANYLELMNQSEEDKRKIFIEYWDAIVDKHNKLTVKINDVNCSQEEFLRDQTLWHKFSMRFTKSPFYDNDDERNENVLTYTTLVCAMMLSLVDYGIEGYEEGRVVERISKSYERNPINREICLRVKGYKCACCGFEFKDKYGKIGENYIEVHHLIPVSEMEDDYKVDPIHDLVPLCSNCHSMIHRKNPPYTVEELKKILEENNDIDQ